MEPKGSLSCSQKPVRQYKQPLWHISHSHVGNYKSIHNFDWKTSKKVAT